MKMQYYDVKAETRLETYADTVVIQKEGYTSYIAAIRFGGYPESVKGMADAIYGGGSVRVEIDYGGSPGRASGQVSGQASGQTPRLITLYSHVKQYRKELSHDGIYAEATLIIRDEEQGAGQGAGVDGTQGERAERRGDEGGVRSGSAASSGSNSNTNSKPRKCYLFCEQGGNDRLFEELDKKTAVPMIPEFKDYILGELQNRGILKPLQVISSKEKFDVWLLTMSEGERNIVSVVNDGLKSGVISIPGAVDGGIHSGAVSGVVLSGDAPAGETSARGLSVPAVSECPVPASNTFPAINSVTQYLNTFGVQIAERIKGQFQPLFDPATEALSPEILAVNSYIQEKAGYSLFDAQLAVAEAHKRCLERGKATLCIAECGSGKTKIGITALHAYQQGRGSYSYGQGRGSRAYRQKHDAAGALNSDSFIDTIGSDGTVGFSSITGPVDSSSLTGSVDSSGSSSFIETLDADFSISHPHTKHFNIVLCPSHMTKKWVREIEESLPDTFAVVVTSITELNDVYKAYEKDSKTCYVIMSKEKARDGYMKRPAVRWNERRRAFVCPDCNGVIEMELTDCGSKYRVSADALFFKRENKQNHKCGRCGSLLWTVLVPEHQTEGIKL